MKPKRQEDSSCVFAYYFVAALADAAIPQEKKERRNRFGADSECGAGHTGYRTSCDPSPGGSQDTGGAFRSRVQRPGVRHRSIGAGYVCPMWQCTDLAQVKRDRHTDRPRKARSIKAFRLRQSILSAEMRRKRRSLPTGEVRPSEHNYDYKEISLYDHNRHLPHPRYPVGQAGPPQPSGQLPHERPLRGHQTVLRLPRNLLPSPKAGERQRKASSKLRFLCKTPKTKSSYRTISFPQFLAARLKALQRSELEQRFRFGQDWQGEDWIFIQDNGKMMSYSTPYEAFQDAIRRYNDGKAAEDQLPLIPFHGLKHTSATLMIASRQDVKTVSSRLDHAQTSTTMNIYAHALQESDRKAADAIENLLSKEA